MSRFTFKMLRKESKEEGGVSYVASDDVSFYLFQVNMAYLRLAFSNHVSGLLIFGK